MRKIYISIKFYYVHNYLQNHLQNMVLEKLRGPQRWKWADAQLVKHMTKNKGQIMVVMTLITTMAFQAAINPPGGVWQEDTPSHKVGEAVIACPHPKIDVQTLGRRKHHSFLFISHHNLHVRRATTISKERPGGFSRGVVVGRVHCGQLWRLRLVLAPNAQTRSLTQLINTVVFFGIMLIWIIIIGMYLY